ncbi:putative ATP synthase subunit e, mitochondrial [Seiridium cardinale]|uniref:ATP synthase subunit e, mitochondrial n=1 Tax=Seiridium cardinale TaxID=138064 RepID=A0ABR2XDW7_9PEZI
MVFHGEIDSFVALDMDRDETREAKLVALTCTIRTVHVNVEPWTSEALGLHRQAKTSESEPGGQKPELQPSRKVERLRFLPTADLLSCQTSNLEILDPRSITGQLAINRLPAHCLSPTLSRYPAAARYHRPNMSASGVNVLRYSALAFGVFYGFSHQRTITATQHAAHAKKEYEHQQQLIEQARAKYSESKNPKPASAEKSGLNQDPMSPNFDLEAYFNALMEQKP